MIIFKTAVRNDRNKKRGKEKENSKKEVTSSNSDVIEVLKVSPEVEKLIQQVSQYHLKTFPNMSDIKKYQPVSLNMIVIIFCVSNFPVNLIKNSKLKSEN